MLSSKKPSQVFMDLTGLVSFLVILGIGAVWVLSPSGHPISQWHRTELMNAPVYEGGKIMILIVTWSVQNPATAGHKQLFREVFPDKEICEVALAAEVEYWESIHKNVRAEGGCVPAKGRGA